MKFLTLFLFIHVYLWCEDQEINTKKTLCDNFIGHYLWINISNHNTENINPDEVITGILNAAKNAAPPLSIAEYTEYTKELTKNKFEIKALANLTISENYLKNLAKDSDIQILEQDKILFKDIVVGHGDIIKPSESGRFKLKSYLIDEKIYYDNTDREQGIIQDLSCSIPGFRVGVEGMKAGGKRKIFIHPDFAYGKFDYLDPNSLLIIETELLEIVKN